jgi:thymidylate kinase
MTKYKSKSIVYKDQYFPSKLECETYKVLEKIKTVKDIQCQYPIKLTPSIVWVVDFKVSTASNVFFIESKGMITQTFRLKYKLLVDLHCDTLSNVILVVSSERALKKIKKLHDQSVTLIQLDNFLQIMETQK